MNGTGTDSQARYILVVSDSSATMSDQDRVRLFSDASAAAVDNRAKIYPIDTVVHCPHEDLLLMKQPKRDKGYWKPRFERMRKT
ncbi:MAG: hypothetical protein PHI12_06750 [Dehalococcoidales bacterium]|nr:hypothetical protein [Dehalococcoidales bacterium]